MALNLPFPQNQTSFLLPPQQRQFYSPHHPPKTWGEEEEASLSPLGFLLDRFPLVSSTTDPPLLPGESSEEMSGEDYHSFVFPPFPPGLGQNSLWPFGNLTSNETVTTATTTDAVNPLDVWWDVFDSQYLRHSLGWTITLIVAYTCILIIGIIGNLLVILVVIFRPQMRTVTNLFIMNLAVADVFVILFCVPGTLLANVFTPWILGSFMCKAVAYVQGVSVCASAYSLAAISLDRCKAIYRPMERPRGMSKRQAVFTICLIWVVALLMTIPWAVIFDVMRNKTDGLTYCVETWKNEQHGKIYFLVANLICCYSLPLVLISLSNVVIWCHVSHRKVPQDSASAVTIKRMHRQTRNGVRKMLGIVTLAFLLSWLPLYILVTRIKFSVVSEEEASILDILMPFAQWLGSWNSSINPVLYAFLNSKFREMFKSLLPSWVPFVHHHPAGTRPGRHQVGRGTVTNGTFTGTLGTPSYTTVFTARNSSARSRNNSRRFPHPTHRASKNNHQSLLVASFPQSATVVPSAPLPTATTTVSALVGGGGGGNGGGVVMTTTLTTTATQQQTAIITDL